MADEVDEKQAPERRSAASTIASGIFASRITGFVRDAAVAYFFGVSAYADVYRTAFRLPNVLQNLLGEGTISAAFIPIYSRLLEEGRAREAGQFAGAVLGLLIATVSAAVLLGVLLAPYLVALLAPGFVADARGDLPPVVARVADMLAGPSGEMAGSAEVNRYGLSVQAVRVIFPMTGVLVLFAWALGVLNSHRRFFLSYFAPVLWNVAIVGALFAAAFFLLDDPFAIRSEQAIPGDTMVQLLMAVFFGALAGGILQLLVPLPLTFKLIRGFRLSLSTRVVGVRESLRAFGPVVAGRGVYQISTYVDLILASMLAAGAVSALGYAQMLYVLPVSLFGMSVAASELPELSRLRGADVEAFLQRIRRSLRQIMFMVVPALVGYIAFGLLIVGALFQRGQFGAADNWLVYFVLVGYSLGLLATTISRLLQNAFYAIGDTKTPAKIAVLRVLTSTAMAVPLMLWLDRFSVSGTVGAATGDTILRLGAVGLAVAASVGAWVELGSLMRSLQRRLTDFTLPKAAIARMLGVALIASVPAAAGWYVLPGLNTIIVTAIVVSVFGGTYLALAWMFNMEEIDAWTGRFLSRGG